MKYIVFVVFVLFANNSMANECVDLFLKEDYYEAVNICTKLANKDDSNAQFALAVMFYQGNGVMADLNKAQMWMRKSAQKNYEQAQYNLGIMLANGHGSKVNLIEAYAWLKLAADNQYAAAVDSLKQLDAELSSTEKEQAQQKYKVLKTEFKF